MSRYSFEIIRRGFDRFSWVFVEEFEGRRRVLARADRDFRKKKQAKKAVYTLQDAVAEAVIIDATGNDPFDLPATSFEIAPYTLPLVVGQPSIAGRASVRRRMRSRDRSTGVVDEVTVRPSNDEALVEAPAAEAAAGPPARAAAAAPKKAAVRAGAPRAARSRSVKKAGRRAAAAPARASR